MLEHICEYAYMHMHIQTHLRADVQGAKLTSPSSKMGEHSRGRVFKGEVMYEEQWRRRAMNGPGYFGLRGRERYQEGYLD